MDERVATEIEETYPGVKVKYDHLTAIVSGQATATQVEEIRLKIRELSKGNGRIHFEVTDPAVPVVRPGMQRSAMFVVARENNLVTLSGELNSRQSIDLIAAEAAKLEGVTVENQLQVGNNTAAFPALGHVVTVIPVFLNLAPDGRLEASQDKVLVSGMVDNEKAKGDLMALFTSDLWEGAEIIDQIRVMRDVPSNFSFVRKGATIMLRGSVDSESTREALAEAALGVEGVTVDNQLEINRKVMAFPALAKARFAIPVLMGATEDGAVEITAKSVVLNALVKNDETKENILGLFTPSEWNQMNVVDQIRVMPPKTPALFTLTKEGRNLTLSGRVDSLETKMALNGAAGVDGFTLSNQMEIRDDINPMTSIDAAVAALPLVVNEIDKARIDINGERVLVAGTVTDQAIKAKILSLFSPDKWGVAIEDQIEVVPPMKPASFTVNRSGSKWVLEGLVDSPESMEGIRKSFSEGGAEVDNQIKVGEGIAPLRPLEAMLSGLPSVLGSIESSKFDWGGKQVIIGGVAKDQATKDRVIGFFGDEAWKDFELIDRIKLVKPYAISITRNANKLILAGDVSSEEIRNFIGNAAQSDGLVVDNQIKVDELVRPFDGGEALKQSLAPWLKEVSLGQIIVSPMQVKLMGEVKAEASKEAILKHFSPDYWSGFKIADELIVKVPMVAPSFTLRLDNPLKVTLSGTVSSDETKQALVDYAKSRLGEGGELVDKLEVAANAAKTPWIEGLPKFASEFLPKVIAPVIEINDQGSSISGTVGTEETLKDVSLAFSGMNPPGKLDINLKVGEMTPSKPMASEKTDLPELSITGKGSSLKLSGKMPSKEVHDAIVGTILNIKDGGIDALDERLNVADNVKDEPYLKELSVFVGKYFSGKVSERELSFKDKKLTLEGVVPSEDEKKQVLAKVDPLRKQGVEVIDKIRIEAAKAAMVPGAAKSSQKPKEEVVDSPDPIDPSKGKVFSVYYGTGEFHLRESEKAGARKLLEHAKETTGRIVIEGFADERGTEELNNFLSRERAERLREFLVGHGIEESRIISVTGRGELPGGVYRLHRRTDALIVEDEK